MSEDMSKEIVPEPSAIVKAHSWSETAVKKEESKPMLSKGASIGKTYSINMNDI